ncbi:hypothetical protein HELRODRAFT_180139 [Helobdella robusta]|uniref:Uncharacterized protein n=1 Tax=Helobdella robusta TaxID=6412 RepID=T1FFI5_HELRO|nr:hypothetical protein HELRODRAFT_180139 [Helobdella robusta]ESN94796.1 hypothetical protein HELRODRAFT_180139 [Helobdella robusta]
MSLQPENYVNNNNDTFIEKEENSNSINNVDKNIKTFGDIKNINGSNNTKDSITTDCESNKNNNANSSINGNSKNKITDNGNTSVGSNCCDVMFGRWKEWRSSRSYFLFWGQPSNNREHSNFLVTTLSNNLAQHHNCNFTRLKSATKNFLQRSEYVELSTPLILKPYVYKVQ